jgi:hypothetical protein
LIWISDPGKGGPDRLIQIKIQGGKRDGQSVELRRQCVYPENVRAWYEEHGLKFTPMPPGPGGVSGAHPRRWWRGIHGPRLPRRAARTASPGGQDMTKPKASKTATGTKASATQQPAGKPVSGSKVVRVAATEGMTRERMLAELAGDGVASNAYTMSTFSRATFGDLELTDAIDVLRSGANTANGGDLSAAVTMLSSQAVALNAMFGELARRSALNLGEYLDASERYMRLALKAQGQCRATLETLAAIKNPPVVFARQANINNGGQQ